MKQIISMKREDIAVLCVNFVLSLYVVYSYNIGILQVVLGYEMFEVGSLGWVLQIIGDVVISAFVLSGGSNSVYDFMNRITSVYDVKSGYKEIQAAKKEDDAYKYKVLRQQVTNTIPEEWEGEKAIGYLT